jgi:hypothetical protein
LNDNIIVTIFREFQGLQVKYTIASVIAILLNSILFTGCSDKKSSSPTESNGEIDPFTLAIGLIEDFPLQDPPANAVHIDPENGDDPNANGSAEHPYASMTDIRWAPNMTVAFKRGTVYETGNQIIMEHDGTTLMSYGASSERPIIRSSHETHAIVGQWQGVNTVTIRDLDIHSVNGTASITFNPTDNGNSTISVINCRLHGGGWGLRAMGITGLSVDNCEVFDTKDDGMFIAWCRDIEIMNCYVHDVNKNWQPPHTPESEAAGDAIQLADCYQWHVHHNLLDRSSSGNKFAFISNNPDQKNGILEFNRLIGPKVDGSSIYIHDGSRLIFRYNIISDCPGYPLYSHASNLKVYGNLFIRMGNLIYVSGSADIFRNTFHDVSAIAAGGTLDIESNIFSFTASSQYDYGGISSLMETHNLYAGPVGPALKSFHGDPAFISVANDDFRLDSGSEAIDRGTETEMLFDMAGTEIPQGEGPDIGAFERR